MVSRATQRIFAGASTPHEFGYLDLFKKISDVDANVRLLSMESVPSDTDVMPRLAAALPGVSTMRLVEFIDRVIHPAVSTVNLLTKVPAGSQYQRIPLGLVSMRPQPQDTV